MSIFFRPNAQWAPEVQEGSRRRRNAHRRRNGRDSDSDDDKKDKHSHHHHHYNHHHPRGHIWGISNIAVCLFVSALVGLLMQLFYLIILIYGPDLYMTIVPSSVALTPLTAIPAAIVGNTAALGAVTTTPPSSLPVSTTLQPSDISASSFMTPDLNHITSATPFDFAKALPDSEIACISPANGKRNNVISSCRNPGQYARVNLPDAKNDASGRALERLSVPGTECGAFCIPRARNSPYGLCVCSASRAPGT
jgi:hypothetical protein